MPGFRLIKRIARLSGHERRLLAEASLCLAAASTATLLLPFRRLAALMSASRPARPLAVPDRANAIRDVTTAVARAAPRMPFRAVCLQQAIAAQWMLRRRGIETSVQFGARFTDGELQAHAWVIDGGATIIGGSSEPYGALAAFPPMASGGRD